MKKILSVFVAVVLVLTLSLMSASAETSSKEWKKGNGPGKISFSEEGTKVTLDEGMQLFYFQNKINIKDFTVKVVLNAPENDFNWGWYAMTIGGNGRYTNAGGSQNFIVLFPRGKEILRVNPQILHNGQGTIEPKDKLYEKEYIGKELTFHFKQVNDTTYSVDINGEFYFEYSIPENLNFVEDMNGEGCLGFGGQIDPERNEGYPEGSFNIVVKEINGVSMSGKEETTSSSSSNTTSGSNNTTGDSNIDPDTGLNTGIIGDTTTADTVSNTETNDGGNTILIIIIVVVIVLLLATVVIVVLLKKKKTAIDIIDFKETE